MINLLRFAWRGYWTVKAFERRQRKGQPFFPAFLMLSITSRCNLRCRGCWVTPTDPPHALTLAQLNGIIACARKYDSTFFGILGGEPLFHPDLFAIFETHPRAYFQLFTNGTLLTDEIAWQLKKLGNVTPLISIEGLKEESDRRRQRDDVYERTLSGVRACRKAGLIFGAAASICQSNYKDLVSRKYIEDMAAEGAMYLWYYIYRPVGAQPNPDNCLTKDQIRSLRSFIVEQRKDAPLFIIDTYWDDQGKAMCPAATGMSHHISPSGAVEFCPPMQMAKEWLNEDASNLTDIFNNSQFLADFRKMTAEGSRGCIIMENPQRMVEFLQKQGAQDTTSRGTVMQEYEAMNSVAGHDMKDDLIPEQNVFYKFLKKRYFFGFGAYG